MLYSLQLSWLWKICTNYRKPFKKALWVFNCLGRPGGVWQYWFFFFFFFNKAKVWSQHFLLLINHFVPGKFEIMWGVSDLFIVDEKKQFMSFKHFMDIFGGICSGNFVEHKQQWCVLSSRFGLPFVYQFYSRMTSLVIMWTFRKYCWTIVRTPS